jgi:all-trans-retinol 13,14-reductase
VLIILFAIIPFYLWLSYWPGKHAKVIPIRASAFSPDKVPPNLDTIVIGSGSGGTSCSNILAQSGKRVLLLEQHQERIVRKYAASYIFLPFVFISSHFFSICRQGGCTHTFRINGCEWDTGLHYTSEGMGLATHRAGALLKFMSRGKQEWNRL